jgi:hypothetical protein
LRETARFLAPSHPPASPLSDDARPLVIGPCAPVIGPCAPRGAPPRIQRGSHAGLPRRQRTDRARSLSSDQIRSLVNAVYFADASGSPLIALMTVLWSHFPDFREENLGVFTARFWDRLSKWLRRRGIELRAVWTRERGQQKGHHMHALVNVPVRLLGPLAEHVEGSYRCSPRAVTFSYGQFGMHTLPMRLGSLRYLCKRLDHRAFVYFGFESVSVADHLGVEHRGTDGVVAAKRAGWTENLGIAARRRAGWREIRDLDALARALNPHRKELGNGE